jgi:hypothetical protein
MTNKRLFLTTFSVPFLLAIACDVAGFNLGQAAPTETQSTLVTVIQTTPQSSTDTKNASKPSAKVTATDIGEETTSFNGPRPGEPGAALSYTDDFTEIKTSQDGYANGGDNFSENQYERPFMLDKTYRPDLDIQRVSMSKDATWFYVTIQLVGKNTDSGKLSADYGVELDVNKDGRGEYVIWVMPAYSSQWKRINTRIYGTGTNQVGGPHPVLSDAPWTGETYNKMLFEGLTNTTLNNAWVRVSPDPKYPASMDVNIAFKPEAVGNPTQFLWGGWADDGIKDPSMFDYNDQFTKSEAGASFIKDPDYPPKAIFAVDNTCRIWMGFEPSESILGSCPVSLPPSPSRTPRSVIRGPG